ncbi:MAG: HAMP domain-containing protein [Rhodomicrobium sp.]|nr:HAMP domain-containing protein [Rhodomicrobium sp.]
MTRFLPRTVAGQLIAVAMIALAVSQVALIAILIDERQSAIRRWWTEYIVGRIASVVELLDETPGNLHQKVLYASDTPLLTLFISDAGPGPEDGIDENSIYIKELRAMIQKQPAQVLVAVNETPSWTEVLRHWFAAWRSEPPPESEPWLEAAVQLKNGKWLNLEVARRLRPPSLALILIPVAAMLLIFGSMLILSIRRITQPVNRLAAAAEAFGRGEESPPIPATGPQEIRRAIEAFNDMRERLSRFVLDRTKMLAAVGHDLRTPITSMRLRAEFIEDEETRARILASLDEIQHMAEARSPSPARRPHPSRCAWWI